VLVGDRMGLSGGTHSGRWQAGSARCVRRWLIQAVELAHDLRQRRTHDLLVRGGQEHAGHQPTERPYPLTPASLSAEQYDESIRRLQEAGNFVPPDGLEYHVCFGSEGNLRVSEIWDSREQLEAFGKRLMPLLAEVGIDPGDPEFVDVYNIIRR
jgi:hypothetical protein